MLRLGPRVSTYIRRLDLCWDLWQFSFLSIVCVRAYHWGALRRMSMSWDIWESTRCGRARIVRSSFGTMTSPGDPDIFWWCHGQPMPLLKRRCMPMGSISWYGRLRNHRRHPAHRYQLCWDRSKGSARYIVQTLSWNGLFYYYQWTLEN
mgnify:CR=1 FL=1